MWIGIVVIIVVIVVGVAMAMKGNSQPSQQPVDGAGSYPVDTSIPVEGTFAPESSSTPDGTPASTMPTNGTQSPAAQDGGASAPATY